VYTIEDGVTQSLLGSFCNCRQQISYTLNLWQPIRNKNALWFGSLWHYLLEQYHRSGKGIKCMPKWLKKHDQEVDPQFVEQTIAMMKILFPAYIKHWQKKDAKKKFVEVEGVFDIVWNGFRLRGRTDGLFRSGKKLWLKENKTAARVDNNYEQGLINNFQNHFYTMVMEQVTGESLAGILYDTTRKSGIKNDRTLPEYSAKIARDVEKRPEFYFMRHEVVFTKKQKKRFKEDLLIQLQEFKRWLDGDSPTYCNRAACVAKWPCFYLDACVSGDMTGYLQTGELFGELKDE